MDDIKEPVTKNIDKEKIVFVICVVIIVVIIVKIFYVILYNFKAKEVIHSTAHCSTYQSLFASELHKGDLADVKPILHQAQSEDCVKTVEKKKESDVKPIVKKEEPKEDKAYNALTIHEQK